MDYMHSIINSPSCVSPPEIVQYVESEARFLPIRISSNGGQTYTFLVNDKNSNVICYSSYNKSTNHENKSVSSGTIGVEDCVTKCQDILGLKINEIAKLTGISRATLDLHRKGANVKNMEAYYQLHGFVGKVETLYGDSIKGVVRNVLINKKTLAQHLIANSKNLDAVMPLLEEVSVKAESMKHTKMDMDKTKSDLRLSGIGRIA